MSDQDRAAREANLRLVRAYANLVAVMRDAIARLEKQAPFRSSLVRRAMQLVFEEALEREWLLVALARLPRGPDAIAQRLSAVAALTLVMTRRLLLTPANTVELCVAALFHDLSRLPGEPQPPSALGLRSVMRCSADALTDEVCHQASVALEWAGPVATARGSARFIAVPSVFELMTQAGPGRPAAATDDVMRLLNQLAGERLDGNVVELFVRTLGFFPPGTAVRLSDGTAAIAVRPPGDGAQLDQPAVRRYDDAGKLSPEEALGGNPALTVREAIVPTVNPLRAWVD